MRDQPKRSIDARCTIGLDLGGTKIFGVALDADSGEILAERKQPNPRSTADDLVRAFVRLIDDLSTDRPPVVGLGVGLAGLVDRSGVLRYGPNVPGVLDFDVGEPLRDVFGVPVVVDNDATMALRAELDRGAGRGHADVLLITQGTGIGGALAVDGRIVRGANGFAGEPGHMLVQRGGHRCACGQLGCWEAYASGAGLVNLWADLRAEGRGGEILRRAGGVDSAVRGEHVSSAAEAGDPDAVEIFRRFAGWVAQGLGSLVTLLDPHAIVLGGGLTAANEHFLSDVRTQMASFVLGPAHRPAVPVLSAELGEAAGAIGAGLAAQSSFSR